ncbi:MAG TPA: NAD-dependent succinate-semialdehyde dehydrogenase [Steroidobacteraceae bacterium]|nr:NAD-dependent succinate-semialdehyde dehydrogenase [Steroidobacteraceae bacterium]
MSVKTSLTLRDPQLLRDACYIDGEWLKPNGTDTQVIHNPATGAAVGSVPVCGEIETRKAIDAAQAALTGWSSLLASERALLMRRWFDLILANLDDLALILTSEQGKTLGEARGEIRYGAAFIEWFAEEGKRIYGDIIPSNMKDRRLLVIRQPIGVVGMITPWNFPMAMIARKAAAALAAGCTVVSKPSPETPLSALAMAELAHRAGIPGGVFNVVTGDAVSIGRELTGNPVVRKLSFTGSTRTGVLLASQCVPTLKKLSLELGGNAPFIVFDDADVDAAIQGAMLSKFRNSGQTCVCTNRFLVQAGIYDDFVSRFAHAVSTLKVGNGVDADVTQGPLINQRAVQKVEQHIADAVAHGAGVVTGGKRHQLGGTFFEPTVIRDARTDMLMMREETFGPVAPVFKFVTESEALQMANATEFGLAAYIYTRDISRAWRMGEQIESGMVGINVGLVSTEVAPFGGVKMSGMGREGSKYGIDDYTEIKYMCFGVG